jgi:hypothetical protein
MRQLKQELDISEVDIHRKEDCVNYDDCIDFASRKMYKSFSCMKCEKYLHNPRFKIQSSARAIGMIYPKPINNVISRKDNQHATRVLKKQGMIFFDIVGRVVK